MLEGQKIRPWPELAIEDDETLPGTPRASQQDLLLQADAPVTPDRSQKRARSSSPPPYQEIDAALLSSSQDLQLQDSPSARRLAQIERAIGSSPHRSASGSRAPKGPRLADALDIHSGPQPGLLTPPRSSSGIAANFAQLPSIFETPSRKGKERVIEPSSPQGIPSSSKSSLSFDDQLALLKAVHDRSERKRVAAERSEDAKSKRIRELEAQVKSSVCPVCSRLHPADENFQVGGQAKNYQRRPESRVASSVLLVHPPLKILSYRRLIRAFSF